MRLGLRRRFRIVAPWLLPERVAVGIWHRLAARHPRAELGTASDVRSLRMDALRLDVYWSDVPGVGSGPSASLFVAGEEVLRLDCFGGAEGHMHLNPEQVDLVAGRVGSVPRLYFPEGSRHDHVERAAFELRRNATAAARANRLLRVQRAPIDAAALVAASDRMVALMEDLLDAHGERPDRGSLGSGGPDV